MTPRHPALAALLLTLATNGCATAMSTSNDAKIERPAQTDAVPLKFEKHNFAAYCYNAAGCRVIYNNHDFSPYAGDQDPDTLVSGPPFGPDYRRVWSGSYLGVRNFPAPARVRWKSLDGTAHEAEVDFASIFKDELVLHNTPAEEMAHFFEGPVAGTPEIILEVNDRTINVYMKMFIPTKAPQRPGHEHSDYRDDLFLAWSKTY